MQRVADRGRQLLMLGVLMMLLAALSRVWGIIGSPLVTTTLSRDESRSFLSQLHRTTNRNLAMSSIDSGQARAAVQAKVYFTLTFGFGVALIAPLLMREQRVGWQAALLFYAGLLVLHLITSLMGGFSSAEMGWLIYDGVIFGLLLCKPVRSRFTPTTAT